MKRKRKHWAICFAMVVFSAAAARLLSDVRFFQLLNLKALDAHFVFRGRVPTSNIMLVLADKKANDAFPELRMFWHPYYAQAIRAAAESGAKAIGLDVAFGVPIEKWEPDYDRLLSEAVTAAPVPVICGYVTELNTKQTERPIPINMITAALGLAGFSNLTVDPDDFVRNQELIEAPSSDAEPPARSMAMRLAEKYAGSDAVFDHGKLVLNGHVIPISQDRAITINYAGPPDTFPHVSLADFIDAASHGRKRQLHDWVAGKVVLIGSATVEDRYPTPFYTAFGGPQWTTAGVEIIANTLRTLLDRRYLLPVPEWTRIAALLVAASFTVGIVTALAAGPATGWIALELAAILIGTHFLFLSGRILSTSELLLSATICLVASIVYRFSTAEKRGALFHKAVALFVGGQFATALDTTQSIGLSGKRLVVTILFTDIRGFTAFTEKVCDEQGPEILVKLLNVYMAQMVSIIMRYHGCVNKFIGDGILAIFSDEDDGAKPGDHAIRAVKCATDIVNAPSEFSTGAGLHTGIAVVGNIGSADKMEYTVLGDTVNLASRLESLNKEHHTKLLMSEATQIALGNLVETVHLAAVPVRGKAAPINLFTVSSLVAASKAVLSA